MKKENSEKQGKQNKPKKKSNNKFSAALKKYKVGTILLSVFSI